MADPPGPAAVARKRVRVGISLQHGPEHSTIVDQARTAENNEFDFLACGEHVFHHLPTTNAFVTLAAAAGGTTVIRLLSSLTILPFYPAALAAKMTATLDQVSGGRFELGIGVGGEFAPEFEACGVPIRLRGARTDEALEVLSRLLSGERLYFSGQYNKLSGLRLTPSSIQRPRPPIWVGGRQIAAVQRAGRFADMWMPYMMTPEQFSTSLFDVRSAAERYDRSRDSVRGAIYVWCMVDTNSRRARQIAADFVSACYRKDFSHVADSYLVTGNATQVTDRITEYVQAGAEAVIVGLACPASERRPFVERFAAEVLPALHALKIDDSWSQGVRVERCLAAGIRPPTVGRSTLAADIADSDYRRYPPGARPADERARHVSAGEADDDQIPGHR